MEKNETNDLETNQTTLIMLVRSERCILYEVEFTAEKKCIDDEAKLTQRVADKDV